MIVHPLLCQVLTPETVFAAWTSLWFALVATVAAFAIHVSFPSN